jgi:hypothetical protein
MAERIVISIYKVSRHKLMEGMGRMTSAMRSVGSSEIIWEVHRVKMGMAKWVVVSYVREEFQKKKKYIETKGKVNPK